MVDENGVNQSALSRLSEAVRNPLFDEFDNLKAKAAAEFKLVWRKRLVRKRLGKNLRILACFKGMNMVGLSRAADLDHTHVSRLMSAKGNCSFKTALALSQLLGVSLQTLLHKDLLQICEAAVKKADEE